MGGGKGMYMRLNIFFHLNMFVNLPNNLIMLYKLSVLNIISLIYKQAKYNYRLFGLSAKLRH